MIDVSELMTDPDFAKCFTVRRATGTFADDGEFVPSYDELEVTGIVQPARPEDVRDMPEGTRVDELISVWSAQALRGSDGARTESDVIVVDGSSYRVVKAEPRADNGYFRVFAQRFVP